MRTQVLNVKLHKKYGANLISVSSAHTSTATRYSKRLTAAYQVWRAQLPPIWVTARIVMA